MQQTYRRCRSILLLTLVLYLPGCSIAYELLLEGQLLSGAEQRPVQGATVTLILSNWKCASTITDAQGNWNLKEMLSESKFWPGKDDKRWTDPDELKLRIETGGQTCMVPCPRVAAPESGGEIYAFVMTVLKAHPEPEKQETLPLEALKPVPSDI